jgi:tetratricopeptide (TPR) repeat protein
MVVNLILLAVLAATGSDNAAAGTAVSARDQLRAAANLKRTSFKKEPSEKRRILLEVVKAYEQVVQAHPQEREECAEALYRQGEILRSLKDEADAARKFEQVLEFKDVPHFRARALIECGHLKRRAGDWKSATGFYQQVVTEHSDMRSEMATAWTWIGRAQLQVGQHKEGREQLLSFEEEFPEFPARAIRNVDLVALSLLESGQTAEAQAMVDNCRTRFKEKAEQEDSVADEIERALAKMRALKRLNGKPAKSTTAAQSSEPADQDDDDGPR